MHIFEPLGAHRMAREASPDTNDNLVPAAFQKEHLAQRWQQARAIGTPLSIVHLRLRQLKEIELAFGHSIAAEVLR
ncbi:diguanylate cyclase [Telluria aromaticivorans]|uniref:Diguanylate cyclase n=1 Tax=Telluria aromaticivorans TaxID=2725995 RepID=A0A7Y2NXX2_9BURK|nr:diguanylate cyclase [Telluria aromaticivorans]NNG21463.1 diguanylate cyclase [Telluria aromaticivorans]